MSEMKRVAVVGGGITGLSTAYYLQKECKEKGVPYEINVYEASDRIGGLIYTEKRDGYTIERGPDSLLARKESVFELIDDLGLREDTVPVSTGKAYVLVKDKLHSIPQGAIMGIPTQFTPFLFSSLFSPLGKLRAAQDLLKPKSKPQEDQSLGEFFRNRLGNEVVENLIEPLLGGVYSGDINRLSLMATFPNFYQLEQAHGSLVKGLKRTRPKPDKKAKKPAVFKALRTGMSSIVDEIDNQLDDGTIQRNTSVDHIEKKTDGYHLMLGTGEVAKADYVIITTPHYATQRMLTQYEFMEPLKEMPATSVANVAMAFDQSAIEKDIDGSGFLVSRNSDYRITACTWTHKKWPHTAPEGKALLRAYVGKPNDQDIVNYSDEEIESIVLSDLNRVMNISGKPEFTVITRWRNSRAQYTVGHKHRIENIKESLRRELPGVYIAGASIDGLGVPDCIRQAKSVVSEIV